MERKVVICAALREGSEVGAAVCFAGKGRERESELFVGI